MLATLGWGGGLQLTGPVVSGPTAQAGRSQRASVWGVSLVCLKIMKLSQTSSSFYIKNDYRTKNAGGRHWFTSPSVLQTSFRGGC